MPVGLFAVCLLACLSACRPVWVLAWLPVCLRLSQPACLPARLPACLSGGLRVCLFAACLSFCLSACPLACLLACLLLVCWCVCLSVHDASWQSGSTVWSGYYSLGSIDAQTAKLLLQAGGMSSCVKASRNSVLKILWQIHRSDQIQSKSRNSDDLQ